jgi:hypothetical protein
MAAQNGRGDTALTVEHPFAATLAQMRKRPEDGGGFARLNEQQKWEWHADTYAFERLVLGREGSPCDPDGKWHNPALVAIAERYYRAKFVEPRQRNSQARDDDQLGGRALVNAWARSKGFDSIDEYAERNGIELLGEHGAYVQATQEIVARAVAKKQREWGWPAAGKTSLDEVRRDLGLTATPEKKWTAEEMAAGRRELGLEPDDGAASAA